MKKKCVFVMLMFLVIVVTAGTAIGQTGANGSGKLSDAAVVKDETVYINLHADGSLQQINVVNRIETPTDGIYTDYGSYSELINLTNSVQPVTERDEIRWSLSAGADGFYYQGRMDEGEPPFLFGVQYYLNGTLTSGEDMAGKDGHVRITLSVNSNPNTKSCYKENYLCQIQTSLNLDTATNIQAPKAGSAIIGRTNMLSYTVMPGKQAFFEFEFDTSAFAFGGFEMTALPFDAGSMLDMDIDEMQDGISELQDGTQELIDGTGDLKQGLNKLSKGLTSLSGGAKDAKAGLTELENGIESFTGGVSELSANAEAILAGLKGLKANAADIQSGYAGINSGIQGIFGALSPYAPPELAAEMAYMEAQMDAYSAGLGAFCAGVSDIADGMEAFCDGLAALDEAGGELMPGLSSIVAGMGHLADGLARMASEIKKLPDAVQELIDGQTELKDGVGEAVDKFDTLYNDNEGKPVSFASEKNNPRSVQFVWKTPELRKKTEAEQLPQQQDETGLLDKIKALF